MGKRTLRAAAIASAFLLSLAAFADGFDAQPKACVSITQSGSPGITTSSSNSSVSAQTSVCYGVDLPYGTGNSQANAHYAATRTLASSTGEDLDLSGTTLKDPLGNSIAFAKVRYILVHAAATNGSTITVKPGASNGFTGPFGGASANINIPANGWFSVSAPVAGWTVTAATGDLFHIGNNDAGGTASYDIVIVGN